MGFMANLGIAPPDASSDVGKIRVLLGDTDPQNIVGGVGEYIYFSDDELVVFLDMYGGNVKLATARCMETIAGSQVLLLKSWSSDDLSVNGDRITDSLRRVAAQLRAEALEEESSEYFNIISLYVDENDHTWWN
jgi:hypothetical protein